MDSFYSEEELVLLGFNSIGKNVLISKKVSIYGANQLTIGSNVRIDDYCILSGRIKIGNYVHISAHTCLFAGDAGIEMLDFSGVSSRCAIYAVSDDYSGEALTNPMIPAKYRKVAGKKVTLERHVVVGSGTTILPGVTIQEGTSIGACSLVSKDCSDWGVYVGVPVKRIKDRSKKLLELEQQFLDEVKGY